MKKILNTKNGFTLAEVLVSVGIMVIFLPFTAGMLTSSRLLASFSKHKSEAAYAAQQIIETERANIATFFQAPIGPIAGGHFYTTHQAAIVLDTKGNYSNTVCGGASTTFCGTVSITVTPAVYTNSAGVTTTSTTTDHFVVTINWNEQIWNKQLLNMKAPMVETYVADIANDPLLN